MNLSRTYFPQIDLIKCFAILAVMFVHTVPYSLYIQFYSQFHVDQQVSMFFIIIGITTVISLSKKQYSNLVQIYSRDYFMSKIKRFVIPFALIFAVSLLIGLLSHNYYIGPLTLIGYLPVTGPGNYFASMLLQYILIAPLIYYLYKKSPAVMLILLIGIDLSFQLIAPHVQIFNTTPTLYHYSILRYVSAIGLGFYISGQFIEAGKVDIFDRKNWFLWALVPIAILYLSMVSVNNNQPFSLFMSNFGYQNIISFSWPLLLVIFILNIKMDKYARSKWFIPISTIGKASYHIFLVQMMYYVLGISAIHYLKNTTLPGYLMAFLIDVTVICIIGLAFYFVQARAEQLLALSNRKLMGVFRSI